MSIEHSYFLIQLYIFHDRVSVENHQTQKASPRNFATPRSNLWATLELPSASTMSFGAEDDGASAVSGGDGSSEPIHDAIDAFNKATSALDA